MFLHIQSLINEIVPDEPDPGAANALQEGLGGQFGEMRTMMQYLFQSFNLRGDASAKPYKDLLYGIGTELTTAVIPDGVPLEMAAERREEFSPGLDAELLALVQATAEIELAAADKSGS